MGRFAVNVSHLTDDLLAFCGFFKTRQGDEFRVYTDKYGEDHLVEKTYPYIFVDDLNDALALKSQTVINIEGADGD